MPGPRCLFIHRQCWFMRRPELGEGICSLAKSRGMHCYTVAPVAFYIISLSICCHPIGLWISLHVSYARFAKLAARLFGCKRKFLFSACLLCHCCNCLPDFTATTDCTGQCVFKKSVFDSLTLCQWPCSESKNERLRTLLVSVFGRRVSIWWVSICIRTKCKLHAMPKNLETCLRWSP